MIDDDDMIQKEYLSYKNVIVSKIAEMAPYMN